MSLARWLRSERWYKASYMETCYICGQPATSKEHVPPKCFFPEKKDLPEGVDYRVNLITVPACDDHNLHKSEDDQYIFLVVVANWQNNAAAYKHFRTKVRRSMQKRRTLRGVYLDDYVPAWVGSLPTGAVMVDKERFDRSMVQMARALHFHEYAGERWRDPIHIASPTFLPVSGVSVNQYQEYLKAVEIVADHFLQGRPWCGHNPDIFCYRIRAETEEQGLFAQMLFYQGFLVTAFTVPRPAALGRGLSDIVEK